MKVSQLYPVCRDLGAREGVYDDLELPGFRAAPGGYLRPYVVVNMVSSADGRAGVSGVASGIGSPVDRSVMRSLRSKADAVMIGAGTLRAEKISLGLDDEERDQPIGVIVCSSADRLPLDHLVSLGKQRVVILTAEDQHLLPGGEAGNRRVEVLPTPDAGSGVVDLPVALQTLRSDEGVGTLVVEGGPSLNASLLSLGLVDELFLTVAPKLLGGDAGPPLTIVGGRATGAPRRDLRLVSAFAAGDELFLRYQIKPAP